MTWKFEPTDPGCGLKTFIQEAIGAASMCWDTPEGAGVFQSERALAIADAIYDRAMSPDGARLGLATTEQLLEELHTRLALDLDDLTPLADMVAKVKITMAGTTPEKLNYRTVDE